MTSNSNKPKIKRNRTGAQIPYKWEKEAFLRDLDADPSLTAGTKAITRVIAHNYDEEKNHSVASVSYIAKAAGMSRRAVIYNVPNVVASCRASRVRKGVGTASSLWAVHWWCRGSSFIRDKFGDSVRDIRKEPVSSGAIHDNLKVASGAIDDTRGGDTDCTTKGASGAIFAPNNIILPFQGKNNTSATHAHGLTSSAASAGGVMKVVSADLLTVAGDTILAVHFETEDGSQDILQIVVESANSQKQEDGQKHLNRLSIVTGIAINEPSDLLGARFCLESDGGFKEAEP